MGYVERWEDLTPIISFLSDLKPTQLAQKINFGKHLGGMR